MIFTSDQLGYLEKLIENLKNLKNPQITDQILKLETAHKRYSEFNKCKDRFFYFTGYIDKFIDVFNKCNEFDTTQSDTRTIKIIKEELDEISKIIDSFHFTNKEYNEVLEYEKLKIKDIKLRKREFYTPLIILAVLLIFNLGYLYVNLTTIDNPDKFLPFWIFCGFILLGYALFRYFNGLYSQSRKFQLLQYLINNPNPNIKSYDKLIEFLLQELKNKETTSTISTDFQKYIKSK